MSEMVKRLATMKVPGYALLIAAFVSLAAVSGLAQAPGANRGLSSGDGNHTIQGRVFFPAEQNASGKTIKVNLEAANATGNLSTVTDQDGSFRFNNVRAGNYRVIVDGGKEYEAAAESVNIDPTGTSAPITSITIQLKMKVDASNPAFAGVPPEALNFYGKGSAAAQKGNAKEAADFLSKAVGVYPNFALALSDLGVQYLKLVQMDKAAETYEALLKLKPADPVAHLNLGIALYNLGTGLVSQQKLDEAQKKLDGAEAHLREAIKLNSPGPSAHYYLGLTLIQFRAYDEAQKEMELAISNGGDNLPQAHRYLGGLYQRAHKNKEAADELEKYLKLDPKAKDADTIKGIIEKLRKS